MASGKRRKRSNPRVRYRKKYEKQKQLEEELERVARASEELGDYVIRYLDEALELIGKLRGLKEKGKTRADVSVIEELEKKLMKLAKRVLRGNQVSLVGLRKDNKGRTMLVDHLVINGRGRVRHYGIHGVRGWNLRNPDEVQFKNKRGEDVEYEEIGPHRGGSRVGRKRKRGRGRGWKKAG